MSVPEQVQTDSPTRPRPRRLTALLAAGWRSKTVKAEIRDNLVWMLASGEDLFPGIIGYDSTVIPDLCLGMLAEHDLLFMGEKGQAKSRLMRLMVRFLDEAIPYVAGCEMHDDPTRPICKDCRRRIAAGEDVQIAWWPRDERYAERLSPGTKFADLIGEIDPAKLAAGTTMGAEEALHFGLVPRMNRGVFAMNELPELDELVQVGLFNILEERDVQIRGYPVRFDLDVLILFSANPATYNRSGKVIPQLKDRIGTIVRTHYPHTRQMGIEITEQEAAIRLDGDYPVAVPYFLREIVEQISIEARKSQYVDQGSGVSARLSIANYSTMVASARRRGVVLGEKPAVPRISDLAHCFASSAGKIELDLMGSTQMSEEQVLQSILTAAIKTVFEEYVDRHGLEEIAQIFAKGVKVEVGDMLPSEKYAKRLRRVPPVWEKAFEISPVENLAMRASCVEFILAGLYATDRVSRSVRHGVITYEIE
ncbi:MAG: magnesium chelatase [Planctomycetes bacterium DG_20]|nr:MAG: magnesium chelatase [Planctomycetes bacterium DG_20]